MWRTVDVSGTLFGEQEVTISATLSGRIEAVFADVGDAAPSGTMLLQIERRDYELALKEAASALSALLARLGLDGPPADDFDPESVPAVRRARAEAENAEVRLERAKMLFEQSPPIISEQEYGDTRTLHSVAVQEAEVELLEARSLLAQARAQQVAVEIARKRLEDASVTSPMQASTREAIQYEVSARLVSLGEYVTPGQPLYRLVAPGALLFRAEVPERFAGQVAVGQEVSIRTEAAAEPSPGKIERVSPRVSPATRTFLIEAIVENSSRRLAPGAFARGVIRLRQESNVTLVPAEAVGTFAGVSRVFSVEEGKVKAHRVTLGDRIGEEIEILGAPPATSVIVTNADSLAEGLAVSTD